MSIATQATLKVGKVAGLSRYASLHSRRVNARRLRGKPRSLFNPSESSTALDADIVPELERSGCAPRVADARVLSSTATDRCRHPQSTLLPHRSVRSTKAKRCVSRSRSHSPRTTTGPSVSEGYLLSRLCRGYGVGYARDGGVATMRCGMTERHRVPLHITHPSPSSPPRRRSRHRSTPRI